MIYLENQNGILRKEKVQLNLLTVPVFYLHMMRTKATMEEDKTRCR